MYASKNPAEHHSDGTTDAESKENKHDDELLYIVLLYAEAARK
jgi:hypothetical protein